MAKLVSLSASSLLSTAMGLVCITMLSGGEFGGFYSISVWKRADKISYGCESELRESPRDVSSVE